MADFYNSTFNNPYPNGWQDLPTQTTPITANALQAHTDIVAKVDTFLDGTEKGAQVNVIEHIKVNGTEQTITNKTVNITTGSGGASALSDLSDVSITSPAANDVLVFNGTNWVNGDAVTDVSYTDLLSKPSLNGVEIEGEQTSEDLNIVQKMTYAQYQALTDAQKNDGTLRIVTGYTG